MSTKTLISGQAGVAVHWERDQVSSYHLDGGQGLKRDAGEVARLFGDSSDVIAVHGLRPDQVLTELEIEWSKQRCLTLCLIALDRDADTEARIFASEDVEAFLAQPPVAEFALSCLFAAPLPPNADLVGAIIRATGGGSKRLVALFEEVASA